MKEDVYDEVIDQGQRHISLCWIVTPKLDNGIWKTKAELVAGGFEETENNFRTDSPMCLKGRLMVALKIAASKCWTFTSIDMKAAFLQGKLLDRKVFLKPPKQAGANGKLLVLKKAVYGLTDDTSRVWYLQVVDELNKLNANISSYDQALFFWHKNGELHGILVVHVNDFLWSGSSEFVSQMPV